MILKKLVIHKQRKGKRKKTKKKKRKKIYIDLSFKKIMS